MESEDEVVVCIVLMIRRGQDRLDFTFARAEFCKKVKTLKILENTRS